MPTIAGSVSASEQSAYCTQGEGEHGCPLTHKNTSSPTPHHIAGIMVSWQQKITSSQHGRAFLKLKHGRARLIRITPAAEEHMYS